MPRTPHTKNVFITISFPHRFHCFFLACLPSRFLFGIELFWSCVNLPRDWSQTAENAATSKSYKSQRTRNFCSSSVTTHMQQLLFGHIMTVLARLDQQWESSPVHQDYHTSELTWFYWSETCEWPKQPPWYLIPELSLICHKLQKIHTKFPEKSKVCQVCKKKSRKNDETCNQWSIIPVSPFQKHCECYTK